MPLLYTSVEAVRKNEQPLCSLVELVLDEFWYRAIWCWCASCVTEKEIPKERGESAGKSKVTFITVPFCVSSIAVKSEIAGLID